jgi:hypothetical protein
VISTFFAVALASSAAMNKDSSIRSYELVLDAHDCVAPIRGPLSIRIGAKSPEALNLDGSSGSALALVISARPDAAFRIRGNFMTVCGTLPVDAVVQLGRTARFTSGSIRLSVTLSRSDLDTSSKEIPTRVTPALKR